MTDMDTHQHLGLLCRTLEAQNIKDQILSLYLDYILVGEGFVGLVVLCVLEEDLVHVGAGILIELVAAAEDDQGDLTVTENRQFVRFFHHPELSFVESHLRENK